MASFTLTEPSSHDELMGSMFTNFLKKTVVGKAISRVTVPALKIGASLLPGGGFVTAGISALEDAKRASTPKVTVSPASPVNAAGQPLPAGFMSGNMPLIIGGVAVALVLVIVLAKK